MSDFKGIPVVTGAKTATPSGEKYQTDSRVYGHP